MLIKIIQLMTGFVMIGLALYAIIYIMFDSFMYVNNYEKRCRRK